MPEQLVTHYRCRWCDNVIHAIDMLYIYDRKYTLVGDGTHECGNNRTGICDLIGMATEKQ